MGRANEDESGGMAPGTVIDGRYKVVRCIGHGGNGLVHEVEHARTGGRLAMKTLLDEAGAARLEQEARATSVMKNGHAARITDMGVDRAAGPYLVMELLEGQSLRDLLDEAGQLPLELTVNIALQVCECLAEAHGLGIIHRDLKPENVFLCASPWPGQHDVKVLDFGVVKIAGDGGPIPNSSLTRTGSTVGTPYYMSLEQLRNSSAVDARADVYSLGVVLYECLSGRKPFQADTIGDLVYALCSGPPTQLARLRPDLPADVADLVMRTLSMNRDDRPARMIDLALGLVPHGASAFGLWVRVDGRQPALGRDAKAAAPAKPAAPQPPKRPPVGAMKTQVFGDKVPAPPRPAAGMPAAPPSAPAQPAADGDSALTPALWQSPGAGAWSSPPAQPAAETSSGQRDTPTEMYTKDTHGGVPPAEHASASGDRDTPTRAFRPDEVKPQGGYPMLHQSSSALEAVPIPAAPAPTFGPPPGGLPAVPIDPAALQGMASPALLQSGLQVTGSTLRLPGTQQQGGPMGPQPMLAPGAPGSPGALGKPAWQVSLETAIDDFTKRFREAPRNMQIGIIAGVGVAGLLFFTLIIVLIVR